MAGPHIFSPVKNLQPRLMHGALLATTVLMLGLSGCAHYRGKKLNRLVAPVKASAEKGVVAFAYQIFGRSDCKRFLDRDVIAKGYQPVQITLKNNTNQYMELSLESFSFPCAAVEEVAHVLHTNTVARAVGYGVAGIFIWPLIIPAIVDGVGSARANERLNADLAHKGLRSQVIAPHSSVNGLIFVPVESFDPSFNFTLTEIVTKQTYRLSTSNLQVVV